MIGTMLSAILLTGGLLTCPEDTPRNGVALIGASATAGWGVIVPAEKPTEGNRFKHVTLAQALDAVHPNGPEVVMASGDPFFFRRRDTTRAWQVDAAIAAKPQAVIGIDFLFWYAYGSVGAHPDEAAARSAHFEEGLKQLDRIVQEGIPIVVGDLPDMSTALDAKPFAVLRSSQVPSPEMLAAMNERLEAWASTRSTVQVLELSSLLSDMRRGTAVSAGGARWGPQPRLMQHDRLHPTSEGLLAVAAAASRRLHDARHPETAFPKVDKDAARTRLQRGTPAP